MSLFCLNIFFNGIKIKKEIAKSIVLSDFVDDVNTKTHPRSRNCFVMASYVMNENKAL